MEKFRWIIITLVLLTSLVGAQAPQKKLSVVVYNLEAQGIGGSISDIMTSAIVTELSQSDKLFVRDEKTTIAVLKEKGMAQTDYCDAETCRIDTAKLIKADRVILGNIGKLDEKTYVVSIRVADVNGTAVYAQTQVCRQCSTEQILGLIQEMARNIRAFLETGKKPETGAVSPPPPPPPPPAPGVPAPPDVPSAGNGMITITSVPPGAEIFLDSTPSGKTPKTIFGVVAGPHQLTLVLEGYSTLNKGIQVQAGPNLPINEILVRLTGTIEISSTPAGANIWIDGKYIGKCPQKIPGASVGKHAVKLTLPDHQDYTGEVNVEPNATATLNANFKGMPGKILVTSTPSGAEVHIDGNKAGVTPYSGQLVSGNHQVSVRKEGYQSTEQNVSVEPNKPKSLDVILTKGPDVRGGMVNVPAGEFTMGNDSGQDDEKPVHKVYLDAFQMDRYEVTNEQYAACVQAGKCEAAHFDDGTCSQYIYGETISGNLKASSSKKKSVGKTTANQDFTYSTGNSVKQGVLPQSFRGGKQPVVCVDWSQARAYCKWGGKRLPTEAEWEKAARGIDGRTYPWGEGIDCSRANYDDCKNKKTKPVESFPKGASSCGAMDMAGNVWEWTAEWYDEKYYQNSPNRNPTGPASGSANVARGGSWNDSKESVRLSNRYGIATLHFRSNDIGIRCARTP